jgi:hypothetical protein
MRMRRRRRRRRRRRVLFGLPCWLTCLLISRIKY